MATHHINKVGVISLGKILGAVYGILGLIFGAFMSLMSLGMGSLMGDAGFAGGLFFGIGAIITVPVFYAVIGFIGGVITALIFNVITGFVGGLEIELD